MRRVHLIDVAPHSARYAELRIGGDPGAFAAGHRTHDEAAREVGELCGITVLDHVVVGAGGYVSLAERGWR